MCVCARDILFTLYKTFFVEFFDIPAGSKMDFFLRHEGREEISYINTFIELDAKNFESKLHAV